MEQKATEKNRRMNEKLWVKKYVDILRKAGAHVQVHSDEHSSGIPDLSFSLNDINGWIEVKFLSAYPKRADTTVHLPHFTAQQRKWLCERGKRSGACYLLLQVANEAPLLFNSRVPSFNEIGFVNKLNLFLLAEYDWLSRLLSDGKHDSAYKTSERGGNTG